MKLLRDIIEPANSAKASSHQTHKTHKASQETPYELR